MSPPLVLIIKSIVRMAVPPLLFGFVCMRVSEGQPALGTGDQPGEPALVRVSITLESPSAGESITVNGRRLSGYQPKILQVFPATGIVIDDEGHIMTFLGYRWVDIYSRDPRIEITAERGPTQPGKMIGIDESVGVAVVRPQSGKFKRTRLCTDCRVHDGATVMAPVFGRPGIPQFETVRILSFIGDEGSGNGAEWVMRINPLPGIGEPILDTEQRVLGFIASQRPAPDDPAGVRTVVYPMSQLLSSAEKIIRAGGDIRSGWLGVYLADSPQESGEPVTVKRVEEESPARRAGLAPEDRLLRWNGQEISGSRRFIKMVQDSAIGSRVALEVLRRGKAITLYPVIQARKYPSFMGRFMFNFPDELVLQGVESMPVAEPFALPRIGITAVPLSAELADGLQIPGQTGLLILGVESGSPLGQAGVMTGDVLLSADDKRVGSIDDLSARLRSRSGRVVLRLLRKGSERNATVLIRK